MVDDAKITRIGGACDLSSEFRFNATTAERQREMQTGTICTLAWPNNSLVRVSPSRIILEVQLTINNDKTHWPSPRS